MNKKQNPLQIRVGDTVEINFPHMPSDPAFLADVTEVVGRTTMGQDAGISYRRLDGKTNEPVTPDGCSVSYVTGVVTRAPYIVKKMPPVNVFAEQLAIGRARSWIGYVRIGGIYVGEPDRLAMIALASSPPSRRWNSPAATTTTPCGTIMITRMSPPKNRRRSLPGPVSASERGLFLYIFEVENGVLWDIVQK